MSKSFDRRKHGSPHTINYSSTGGARPPSPKIGKKGAGDGAGGERVKAKQSLFSSGSNRKSPTSAIYENER